MKTLIVAATKAELTYFYQHFNLSGNDFIQSKTFDVLITGVGMVATAYALGKHLNLSRYNLVLNLGIAGCFDRTIKLGNVLNITEDVFAELGAQNGNDFLSIKQLGFGENAYTSKSETKIDLPKVKGISVNCVTGNENTIKRLIDSFNPITESMEGAAVFYACDKEKIDCLQIRSISNYVEARNKDNWKIGLAIENLNSWAIDFVEKHTMV